MKKILVIEDNAAIRENTAELLMLGGFHVLTAENGTQGYVSALHDMPDLILCDMMMPETDGSGFLKLAKMNASISAVPIVFFSADTVSRKVHISLVSNSHGYLRKPFLEEDLMTAVNMALKSSV
jgi:CheY-like chemotaxis protein